MKKTLYRIANYFLNKQWVLHIVMRFLSEGKKEQIYIARFRAELVFWGHDVSNMTDEEIKEGISKMGEMVSQCGMTTDEVAVAFKALGKTIGSFGATTEEAAKVLRVLGDCA